MGVISKPRLFTLIEPFIVRGGFTEALAAIRSQPAKESSDIEELASYLTILATQPYSSTPSGDSRQAATTKFEAIQTTTRNGYLALLRGNSSAAEASFRKALDIESTIEVFGALALAMLPGPSYLAQLRYLHETAAPTRYLEIGVSTGNSIRLAGSHTDVIGIDPEPLLSTHPTNTRIYRVTSDEFFRSEASRVLEGGPRISLAFLDGLHLFEQLLQDIINVEAFCGPNSVIALHDTLPVAERTASRTKQSSFWCGDVWKIIPCLQHFRPDLRITTLPAFPSGLTLLTGLDPSNTVLRESMEDAKRMFADCPFSECSNYMDLIRSKVINDFATTAHAISR